MSFAIPRSAFSPKTCARPRWRRSISIERPCIVTRCSIRGRPRRGSSSATCDFTNSRSPRDRAARPGWPVTRGPANDDERDGKLRFRTIWISDLHLGTAGCQAALLLEFLRQTESEHLYLVGDIIDGWQLRRRWYWPQTHNDVVQKILRKARKGTNVIYVPGNHDEAARQYCQLTFGDVRVQEE